MAVDLNIVIRDYALTLVEKIKETNKAVLKSRGYPVEIGRNMAFALSLYILLRRLESSGVNLEEMGLSGIDPLALIEPLPKVEGAPAPKRRSYRKRRRR